MKLSNAKTFILQFIIGGFIGITFVLLFIFAEHQGVSIFSTFVFLVVACIVQIAIHELGHLIGGLLSGYQFLSYRLFSFAVVLEDKKLRVTKQKVPGTLGQCLMIPPIQEKDFSFKLYISGGVLMNIIVSLFAFIWFPVFPVYVLEFALVGFLFALMNGVPNSFNDGSTYKLASSSTKYQHLLYNQLDINARLHKGETFVDLPNHYFGVETNSNSETNYFDDFQSFLELGYYLEKRDFDKLKIALEKQWLRLDQLILPYQLELKKEMLFFLLTNSEDDSRIEELVADKQLTRYLKNPLISNFRVRAAKASFYDQNREESVVLINKGIALENKTSSRGEYLIERDLLLWLKESTKETLTLNND